MKNGFVKMKTQFFVLSTLLTTLGAGRMKMNDITHYDPDGGYWDPETDTWVKYNDMERVEL